MRIRPLLRAQALEARRNPSLLILPCATVILTLIWVQMSNQGDRTFLIAMSLLMSSYMIGFQFPAVAMAEDREKRTLEAVLLTPTRPLEVIAARTLLTACLSTAVAVICLVLYRYSPPRPDLLALGFALALAFAIAVGLTIGVLARDQKTASVMGALVMLLLVELCAMPWETISPTFWRVQAWLPSRPVMELLRAGTTGARMPVLQDSLVMLGYVALMVFICARRMRKVASVR